MKFLLASAAAVLVASSVGASAADLAKKAPIAVDYVKVCDAYGAGFFYIPGTDTCLKIGGYLRAQVWGGDSDDFDDRADNRFNSLARLQLQIDARSQTEYGVLRAFGAVNFEANSGAESSSGTDVVSSGNYYDVPGYRNIVDKAYIQWAGFTFGFATSMFDFFTGYAPAVSYGEPVHDDTVNLAAYTFGFANGVSATISVEDPTYAARQENLSAYDGVKAPDIVGNIKIEQGWGTAQLMGVAHNVYANGTVDKWGYAIGGGVTIKLPMLGADDEFGIQAAYAKGALRYLAFDLETADDVVPGTETLDKGWSVLAGLKHGFSPNLVGALQAGYVSVDSQSNDQDFDRWDATVSLTWTPVANLDLTTFVEYRSLDYDIATTNADVDSWVVGFRAQRNF